MEKQKVFQIAVNGKKFEQKSVHSGGPKNLAQNGKYENGEKVGQQVFRLIGIENHRMMTSKQTSNLKSLEAEITK